MRAILQKELRSYFASGVAPIVVAGIAFFAAAWLFLVSGFFANGVATLRGYFGVMPLIFVLVVPALTMRMWAEERREGTDELLATLPVGDGALVVAKFGGGMVILALALLPTLLVPVSLAGYGPFVSGASFAQYLGLICLGAATVALGELVSLLVRSQISAYVLTALALLGLTLIGGIGSAGAGPAWRARVARFVSFDTRFESFARGLIDTADVGWFLGVAAAALTGCVLVMGARRRGRLR